MKRKTPIKHHVKSYKRNEKIVREYDRGKGSKSAKKIAKPTLNVPKGYTVNFIYSNKLNDKETIKVIATTYQRAIDEAFEEKHDVRHPIEISVIDPSLGEIIKWAGKRAIDYSIKAARVTGDVIKTGYENVTDIALEHTASTRNDLVGALAQKHMSSRADKRAEALVKQAYSRNKTTRTLARAKLRKDHPHVWDSMDISQGL